MNIKYLIATKDYKHTLEVSVRVREDNVFTLSTTIGTLTTLSVNEVEQSLVDYYDEIEASDPTLFIQLMRDYHAFTGEDLAESLMTNNDLETIIQDCYTGYEPIDYATYEVDKENIAFYVYESGGQTDPRDVPEFIPLFKGETAIKGLAELYTLWDNWHLKAMTNEAKAKLDNVLKELNDHVAYESYDNLLEDALS